MNAKEFYKKGKFAKTKALTEAQKTVSLSAKNNYKENKQRLFEGNPQR